MKQLKKLYLVWDIDGYYSQFDSIVDAVKECGEVEIFEANLKSIGTFEIKTSVMKAKKTKKVIKGE